MKYLVATLVILFSGLAFADYCNDRGEVCSQNLTRDLAFCSTQGAARANCELRARETFASCLNGC
jgi:hypothetical protein